MPTNKRKAISSRTRFEVFKRDGFKCAYCGRTPPTVILNVDHIIAVANGGTSADSNLVTSCFDCNAGKSDKALSVVPKSLSDKAAESLEREAQVTAYAKILQAETDRIDSDAIRVADVFEAKHPDWLADKEFFSIKRFVTLMPAQRVVDAAEVALNRFRSPFTAFKYFCGTCWRMIKQDAT